LGGGNPETRGKTAALGASRLNDGAPLLLTVAKAVLQGVFVREHATNRHPDRPLRVLHSFPHRLGADRICTTAWHEIDSVAAAGAEMTVIAGDLIRPFPQPVRIQKTFAWGRLRLPYRILGTRRMCALHDFLVARRLPALKGAIDIIHAWPLGALRTIRAARPLGIPVALERCNAHTRFAYEAVQKECERIGVPLPPGHEHAFNVAVLEHEEREYAEADALLCPSEFVVKTFMDQGFPRERLVRFIYGVDEKKFYPSDRPRDPKAGLKMIFVGVCAVRKGLHFALEAWLKSAACKNGQFLIAGGFIPAYREELSPMLAHPSVKILGHRNDVPALMRECDLFILPSIEEGFGLVCTEAMASGCVPLVSNACTELCRHKENALVHSAGDVDTLTRQITMLHMDRALLAKLRTASIQAVPEMTWRAAGVKLLQAYCEVIAIRSHGMLKGANQIVKT
jgi:D-inositol-3-phosphate glycosyltransferase